MADVVQYLYVESGQALTSAAFPAIVRNGTNFTVIGLAFSASTVEEIYFHFKAINYASGNLSVTLDWYADTSNTLNHTVRWSLAFAAITPNTDSGDIETKAMSSVTEADDDHLGTTGQREHSITISASLIDSVAAGDSVWMRVRRNATHANNDLTGDAILVGVTVAYLSL